MDQTVPYRRITGANKEPLGCGRGPASESLAKANESDQPRAGDREADMFLQTFQYQPRDNTTHLPAQTMHATRDEKPPSFDRLMSLPSASRYLPPAPMVDQPETEALSGNGVDFPKCFHCGRWKIDVCHAAHSTECRAACMYCKNAQHNGRVSEPPPFLRFG